VGEGEPDEEGGGGVGEADAVAEHESGQLYTAMVPQSKLAKAASSLVTSVRDSRNSASPQTRSGRNT